MVQWLKVGSKGREGGTAGVRNRFFGVLLCVCVSVCVCVKKNAKFGRLVTVRHERVVQYTPVSGMPIAVESRT